MKIYTREPLHEAKAYKDLRELVSSSAERFGPQPAYIFRRKPGEKPQERSYIELWQDVKALGEYVLSLFPEEQRAHFAFIGPNSYEWIVMYLAAMTCGTVAVPLDNALPEGEVLNLLERGDCDLACVSVKHWEAGVKGLNELDRLKVLIINDLTLGKKDKIPQRPEAPEGKTIVFLSEALKRGESLGLQDDAKYPGVTQRTEELGAIFFTSGTTAAAKGVMLSQRNILENIHGIIGVLPVYPGERFLSVLPMHHTFEHTAGQLYPLSQGVTICFTDGLRYIGDNMREWEISCMIGVPLLFESIWRVVNKGIEHSGKKNMVKLARPIARRLESAGIKVRRKVFAPILEQMGGKMRLMVVGAAAADIDVIKGFNDLGIEFFQGYGLTEHSPVISVCNSQVNSEGSVGQPLPGVEVRIQEDPELEAGQGEVLARSGSVMLGYYKNEQATKEIIDADGWLHTGDMGYFDYRDSLHITGRYKSVIVLANGKKAFPEEIESLFANVEGVSATMIWGELNLRDTVDVAARFEIKPELLPADVQGNDRKISAYLEKEVRRVNKLLPDYKNIKYFVFSDEPIIRNTTLKIKRNEEIDKMHLTLLTSDKTIREVSGKRIY